MKMVCWGQEFHLKPLRSHYSEGNLAVVLIDKADGAVFANATVNLCDLGSNKDKDRLAYLDTNNVKEIEKFVKENGLGVFTGKTSRSGFCEYPLYRFNIEKIEEMY